MTYNPLKKEIVFDETIISNPHYQVVMKIVKACGDKCFKKWLIEHIKHSIKEGSTDQIDNLTAVGNILNEIIGREIPVNQDFIYSCQLIFTSNPHYQMVSLLRDVLGFLLTVQKFERQILAINQKIENGESVKPIYLTRDGNAPTYIPRSRQEIKKYGA